MSLTSSTTPSCSTGSTMATTQQVNIKHQAVSAAPKRNEASTSHFVDQHRVDLIKRVKMVDSILDLLLAEGVITHEGLSNVRSKPTSMEKMRELYELLHASGTKAKEIFYKGLEENEQFLLKDLNPPSTVQTPLHGPQDGPDPSMTDPLMTSAGPHVHDPKVGVEKELLVGAYNDPSHPPPTVQTPLHGQQDGPDASMNDPLMMISASPDDPGVEKELPEGAHEGGGSSPVPEDKPLEDMLFERTSSCWQMGCCAATPLSERKKRHFMGWGLLSAIVGFGFQMYGAAGIDAKLAGNLPIVIFCSLSAVTCFPGIIAGIVSFKHSWSCKGRSLLAAGIMFLVSTFFHMIGMIIVNVVIVTSHVTSTPLLIIYWLSLSMPFTAGVLYICAYRRRGTVQY